MFYSQTAINWLPQTNDLKVNIEIWKCLNLIKVCDIFCDKYHLRFLGLIDSFFSECFFLESEVALLLFSWWWRGIPGWYLLPEYKWKNTKLIKQRKKKTDQRKEFLPGLTGLFILGLVFTSLISADSFLCWDWWLFGLWVTALWWELLEVASWCACLLWSCEAVTFCAERTALDECWRLPVTISNPSLATARWKN